MTIYLRNEENETLMDLEIWEKNGQIDLRSAIPIRKYSKLLLSNPSEREFIIDEFEFIDEIRRWYWEVFMEGGRKNDNSLKGVIDEIKKGLSLLCEKLNLHIVTD